MYLRIVDKYLIEHSFYQRTAKLMKSKNWYHKEGEAIDEAITQATQYGKNNVKNDT